ncbi:MAG TPA: ABC transporter substrate-binding protein [bacterium]|nr:ABC transporter substrate-binding protein [bacterium]
MGRHADVTPATPATTRQHVRAARLGRRQFLTLAGASLGAMAAGLAGDRTPAAAAPTRGGTLVYGLGFDLDNTMDPAVTNFDSTIRVTQNICEPLVWEPTPGRFVPALAESWSISPDVKTYTFKLKRGVRFTDGTPFNAAAVKFSLDRIMDPATKAGQSHDQIGPYDHTEIVDDYTVRVVMKEGYAPLLTNLNGYLGIVSPTAVKQMGAEFARHPVGTGPFVFKEWVTNDHITLVRNPDYNWGSSFFKNRGPAYLDQVVFKIIPDASVRTGTLKSGETQYIDDIDPLQYADLRRSQRFSVVRKGQPGSGRTLLLNVTSKGPVADIAVRRAMEYGVDRDGLNQSVFHGLMEVAWSPLMKVTFGYDPAAAKIYTFDPAKAKAMFEEAGWKVGADGIREKAGQKLTLDFPIIGRPRDKAMAESIQASLHDVGMNVIVTPLEIGAFRARVAQNQYDANFMWLSYGDPDALRAIFHTQQGPGFNRGHYSVPEVDRWLEQAAAINDKATRARLYAQIQQRVLRDAECIPLVDTITYNAKRAEVQDEYLDALASYVYLNDVYLRK